MSTWLVASLWAVALALNLERIADWVTGAWADLVNLVSLTKGR